MFSLESTFPSLFDRRKSEKVIFFYKINILVICDLLKQYFLDPIPPISQVLVNRTVFTPFI